MLILTRKIDEKILIGENIEVTVVKIIGDCVKLGIQAPKEISIMRPEAKRWQQTPKPWIPRHD